MRPEPLDVVGAVEPDRRFDPDRGIIVATDASVQAPQHRAASGFLATSGCHGVAASLQPPDVVGTDVTTVAELR